MTRKLGRLLVVALVVAAVVAPMSVASADVGEHLECYGIEYDATNPFHVKYPLTGPVWNYQVQYFVDEWELWDYRHHFVTGMTAPTALEPYMNVDMGPIAAALGAPPAGETYVFFWNDLLEKQIAPADLDPHIPLRIVGTPYDDIICGSPYNDVIRGLGGDDVIVGSWYTKSTAVDDDILQGGAGDDILIGNKGSDALAGNAGDDHGFGDKPPAGSTTTPGGPYPYGPSMPSNYNEFFGQAGNDYYLASEGNSTGDEAWGGPGMDELVGQSKPDTFHGGAGTDVLKGGDGADYLYGDYGSDTIWGEKGSDHIEGGPANDTLFATSPDLMCNPHLSATCSPDTVADGGVIFGEGGDDTIYAGFGSGGHFYGNKGGDAIHGSFGIDYIYGGPGNDWIKGAGDADVIRAGEGDDTVFGGYGVAVGGIEPMQADGVTPAHPDLGDDIQGGDGGDSLSGERGVDTIFGGYGSDWINGGLDGDKLWGDTECTNGAPCSTAVQALHGNDTILGEAGADNISGGYGIDILDGGDDNDIMSGIDYGLTIQKDTKVDTFYGGKGNDTYYGACGDLDVAHELVAGGSDTAVYVQELHGFFGEVGDTVIQCV